MIYFPQTQPGVQTEQSDFTGISDDEMLAAVLEMSRHETTLAAPPEDDPTSSPDTGFGDADGQDLTSHMELMEADKPSTGWFWFLRHGKPQLNLYSVAFNCRFVVVNVNLRVCVCV